MLMTSTTHSDPKTRQIGALFQAAYDDISSELEYKDWGYQDYEPDADSQQLNSWWGPGKGTLTVEGQTYGSNQRWRDYPVTITMRKWTSRLTWTEEDLHWLSKGSAQKQVMEINSMIDNAVGALQYNIDEDAAQLFYLGHLTTFFTGGDGLSLYNTSHTIRNGGGTQANNFGSGDTHRPFSETALVDLVNKMNRFVGANNVQLRKCRNLVVLCATELAPTVQKVIDSLYGPNNPNLGLSAASAEAFKKRKINVSYKEIAHIPTAYKNYYFVVDTDRAKNRLFFCWGWRPRLANDTVYSNGTFENDASALFGPTALGFQFTFSSKGDNSAIA